MTLIIQWNKQDIYSSIPDEGVSSNIDSGICYRTLHTFFVTGTSAVQTLTVIR